MEDIGSNHATTLQSGIKQIEAKNEKLRIQDDNHNKLASRLESLLRDVQLDKIVVQHLRVSE